MQTVALEMHEYFLLTCQVLSQGAGLGDGVFVNERSECSTTLTFGNGPRVAGWLSLSLSFPHRSAKL